MQRNLTIQKSCLFIASNRKLSSSNSDNLIVQKEQYIIELISEEESRKNQRAQQ
jgi:hypothetical protein